MIVEYGDVGDWHEPLPSYGNISRFDSDRRYQIQVLSVQGEHTSLTRRNEVGSIPTGPTKLLLSAGNPKEFGARD